MHKHVYDLSVKQILQMLSSQYVTSYHNQICRMANTLQVNFYFTHKLLFLKTYFHTKFNNYIVSYDSAINVL
jgi:hypothetical protein